MLPGSGSAGHNPPLIWATHHSRLNIHAYPSWAASFSSAELGYRLWGVLWHVNAKIPPQTILIKSFSGVNLCPEKQLISFITVECFSKVTMKNQKVVMLRFLRIIEEHTMSERVQMCAMFAILGTKRQLRKKLRPEQCLQFDLCRPSRNHGNKPFLYFCFTLFWSLMSQLTTTVLLFSFPARIWPSLAKSLQEFATVLQNLEDERTRMVRDLKQIATFTKFDLIATIFTSTLCKSLIQFKTWCWIHCRLNSIVTLLINLFKCGD